MKLVTAAFKIVKKAVIWLADAFDTLMYWIDWTIVHFNSLEPAIRSVIKLFTDFLDILKDGVKIVTDITNAIGSLVDGLDPPQCLLEALQNVNTELDTFNDKMGNVAGEIEYAVIPSVEGLNESFGATSDNVSTAGAGITNTAAGNTSNVNHVTIHIEGDVKDEETIDRMQEMVVDTFVV